MLSSRRDPQHTVQQLTVDPQRRPLNELVAQLLTLVVDESGQLFDVPHAGWSIRATWN